MTLSRRHFLSTAAIGLSGTSLLAQASPAQSEERTPIHFHILKQSEYDHSRMIRTLSKNAKHKQVFQSVSPLIIAPGVASIYLHVQNSMNAYEFSLGLGKLSTLAVLIGSSIVFALNDKMWKKYAIGQAFLPEFTLAGTNEYYYADSKLDLKADPGDPNGIYQDWSAQAVLKRGGEFFVCHNATTGIAQEFALKLSSDPKAILADFEANLVPGFQMVPSGVAAMQQAQEYGWKAYSII